MDHTLWSEPGSPTHSAAIRRGVVGWFALVCAAWLGALPGRAGSVEQVRPYLRATRSPDGASSLEVAMRRLAPTGREGPTVWLVAVTHLGTPEYYDRLQQFLDASPLVLFEAVRTDDDGRPGQREGYSLQSELAKALGLTFQLDAINYDRSHFRNSDLHLDQLTRILAGVTNAAAPGASTGTPNAGAVEFGALLQAMTGEGLMGGLARVGVGLLRSSPRLQAAMKVAMIEMFSDLPGDLSRIPGLPEGMQQLLRVLIEERNAAVVHDVRDAAGEEPAPASLAVFYGAGHMPDLEARLCKELGYQPVEDRWLKAFEVNPRAAGISEFEVAFTKRLVRAQLQGMEAGRSTGTGTTNAPAADREPK